MKCDFDYCIYNTRSICVLDEIQIDSLGMCIEYEIVTIPKEILEKYKKRRLKEIEEIEEIWKNYDK